MIWGWVRVGTQHLSDSIDSALEIENASRALQQPLQGSYTQSSIQRGLVVAEKNRSGLTPVIKRGSNLDPGDSYRISSFGNIRGDEKRRGPVFNYARVFTYGHVVGTVHHALQTMMDNVRHHKPCGGQDGQWIAGKHHSTELQGSAENTEAYCGLDQREIFAYPEWSQIPGSLWAGIVVSAFVATLLQWGTTGAAIMIAYLTPVVGLGCRSGGYLLYGITATVVWVLLTVSSFFSHSAMLRFQRKKQKAANGINSVNGSYQMGPTVRTASNTAFGTSAIPQSSLRTAWDIIPVQVLAAVTRYAGKTLAVANTFFLIAISLFEFTGGFDNCWCKSDALSLGQTGWIVLFKLAPDLKQAASVPWGTGIALSVFICMLSYGVFWVSM